MCKLKKILIFSILFFCLGLELNPALAYGDTEIRINIPSRTLQLIQGNKLIKEFSVGVGSSKANMTPSGTYAVDKKVINPIWEHPYKSLGESRIGSGANNPLGTHWIGFHSKGGGVYGIHGTNQPSSIGHFVSHGCVRMHNAEVEELFDLVDFNTPVIVTYNRYRLHQTGNTISIEVFPDPYKTKAISKTEVIEEIRKEDSLAQIDFELLERAINDSSEKAIYEIAVSQSPQMPQYNPQAYPQMGQTPNYYYMTQPYYAPYMQYTPPQYLPFNF